MPKGDVVFMKLHITISKAATQRVGHSDGAGSDRGGIAVERLSTNSCDKRFTPARKYWKRRYFS
jgi:cell wall-associated NlpC family hydrolase